MDKLVSLTKKIFIAIAIILFGVAVYKNDWFYAIYALAIIPATMVFDLIKALTKFRIAPVYELIYLVFIFFAQIVGINLRVYYLLEPYDKIIHFISGALTTILALLLIHHFKISLERKSFRSIFALSLTLAIASIWEIFEYTVDLFGGDMQRVATRGIHDTMQDMICALAGGIVVLIIARRPKKIVEKSDNR